MEKFTFAVPCLFGLEGPGWARSCGGWASRRSGWRTAGPSLPATFWTWPGPICACAMGERVMLLLGRFEARTFEALYQGVQGPAPGGPDPPGWPVPRQGLQPQQPAPLGARLSGHRQKGRRGPAGGQVRPHLAAGDRGRLSDPLLPDEGRLRGLPGYLRFEPSQAGLPGCGQRSAPP